ncbi:MULTISPECIES: cell division protein FtsL [Holospora]|uniref:Cell division protein FtsL n=2 Tax=Holospora TaxID=44747 RepID=A0A061JG67_9PROT|nr:MULTISPECIES: cell division protein FtsL [Holospora]ETZ04926.1 cell division protein FtsL [Holospora undulata HU1]GAJ46319.1 cell division protein FtsL [Holospora elegans E1]
MKIVLCSSFIMATLSGMFLFHVKYQVMALEREYQTAQSQCVQLEEQISILQSQWCYLTRPERVEALINHHWSHWGKLNLDQVIQWPNTVFVAKQGSDSSSGTHF